MANSPHIGINTLFLSRPLTGTGQYTLHLLGALEQYAHPWHLVPLSSPLTSNARGRWENIQKLLWEQLLCPLRALQQSLDLLHVPYWAPPLVAPCPVVVTIHDIIPIVLPQYQTTPLVAAYTRLVTRATRRAEALIVDSEATRRDIIHYLHIPPDRLFVAPLAASPHLTPVVPDEAAHLCLQRWGLSQPFLLYIGSNDIRKNLKGLLLAWQRAVPRLPHHQLVIAGNLRSAPPLFPDIHTFADSLKLPRLRFLPPPAEYEKAVLLSACEAFIWPSLYEGFGLPPLEAMQVGAPVASSNTSSMPEVIGGAGLLFDPHQPASMADAMIRLGTEASLRAELHAAGIRQAQQFTWARTTALTIAVYHQVLNRNCML